MAGSSLLTWYQITILLNRGAADGLMVLGRVHVCESTNQNGEITPFLDSGRAKLDSDRGIYCLFVNQ